MTSRTDDTPGSSPLQADELDGIPPDVYRRRWLILGVLTLSLVTVVIAVSSLNVAIPRIQEGLDASRAKAEFGFEASTPFDVGLRRTVDWYLSHRHEAEARDV